MSEAAAGRASRVRAPVRLHCDLDDWTFDPRYTDGRCPICGWAPEGAPTAPRWLIAARTFEWEVTGLVVLLVVLVVLGAVVAHAAGYRIPLFSSPTNASVGSAASPARTAPATASPHTSASPSASVRPSPSR